MPTSSEAKGRAESETAAEALGALTLSPHLASDRGLLELIVAHVPVAIAVMKAPDLEYAMVNPAYQAILGPQVPTVGRKFSEIFPAAAARGAEARLLEVIRTGTVWRIEDYETEIPGHPGPTWWGGEALPLRGNAGEIDAVLVVCWEITERKRAAKAQAESEARYRAMFEGASVAILEKDFSQVKAVLDGLRNEGVQDLRRCFAERPDLVRELIGRVRVVGVNHAAARMLGAHDRTQLLRPLSELFLPETEQIFVEELVALGEGKAIFEGDAPRRTLQGERVEVLVSIAFPPRGGDFSRVLVIMSDITERKRMEAILLESERRYRAVVESQSEMVCRFRPDGTIRFVNEAYARSCGTTAEALAGMNFWDFVPENDRAAVHAMLDKLTPEAPEVRIENRFDTVDGTRWTLWTNRALAFDAKGAVIEAQSTGIDITDRKRAEEALIEADRRKDEFLATLAHELRNPLAPLKTALQIMRLQSDAASEPVRQIMERQVNQLVRLVDDLLEISRITTGALELRYEPVELETVVRSAVETCEPLIKAARHAFNLSLPGEALWVKGDPVRLAQVVANLLNNAAKYTPPGGEISLTVQREPDGASISVEDNGVGIAGESLKQIFEMFGRSNRTRSEMVDGLGIGLTLAQRLAQMHGGDIDVRSEGEGRGSEFIVRLPLEQTPIASAHQPPAAEPLMSGMRILVVDDNRDAATTLAMVLKLLNAEVQLVHNGPAALDAVGDFRPMVVLLDLGMPGMDGYETARRLRARYPGETPVLVALTGWGQDQDRRRTEKAGFAYHLVKPADLGELQKILIDIHRGSMTGR